MITIPDVDELVDAVERDAWAAAHRHLMNAMPLQHSAWVARLARDVLDSAMDALRDNLRAGT